MKKMERLTDRLFQALEPEEGARVAAGLFPMTNFISLIETNHPNPDEVTDHG